MSRANGVMHWRTIGGEDSRCGIPGRTTLLAMQVTCKRCLQRMKHDAAT